MIVQRQKFVACRRRVARTVVHGIRRVIDVTSRRECEPDEASCDLQLVDADRFREGRHGDVSGARRSLVCDEQRGVLLRRPRTLVPRPDLLDINPNVWRCSCLDARLRVRRGRLLRWRGGRRDGRRRTRRRVRAGLCRRRRRDVRHLARPVLVAGPLVGSGSAFARVVRCPRAPQHRDQPRNRSGDHQSDRKKIAKPGYAWIAHEPPPPNCIVNKDVHRRARTPWPSHHLSARRQMRWQRPGPPSMSEHRVMFASGSRVAASGTWPAARQPSSIERGAPGEEPA